MSTVVDPAAAGSAGVAGGAPHRVLAGRGPRGATPRVGRPASHVDRDAVSDILPVVVSIAPFGMVVGVAAAQARLGAGVGLSAALFIYGGSAQLAATTMLASGAGVVAILAAVAVIQARLLLYGAALEPLFRDQPRLFRWLGPATIVDQTYALATARRAEFDAPERFRRYWLTLGGVLGAGWLGAVAAGLVLGPVVAAGSPLSVAAPATFVGLLVPRLRDRPAAAAAATAAVVAALASALPNGLGLLVGVGAGMVAGWATRRRAS